MKRIMLTIALLFAFIPAGARAQGSGHNYCQVFSGPFIYSLGDWLHNVFSAIDEHYKSMEREAAAFEAQKTIQLKRGGKVLLDVTAKNGVNHAANPMIKLLFEAYGMSFESIDVLKNDYDSEKIAFSRKVSNRLREAHTKRLRIEDYEEPVVYSFWGDVRTNYISVYDDDTGILLFTATTDHNYSTPVHMSPHDFRYDYDSIPYDSVKFPPLAQLSNPKKKWPQQ